MASVKLKPGESQEQLLRSLSQARDQCRHLEHGSAQALAYLQERAAPHRKEKGDPPFAPSPTPGLTCAWVTSLRRARASRPRRVSTAFMLCDSIGRGLIPASNPPITAIHPPLHELQASGVLRYNLQSTVHTKEGYGQERRKDRGGRWTGCRGFAQHAIQGRAWTTGTVFSRICRVKCANSTFVFCWEIA